MMKTSVSVLTLCIAVLVGGSTFAQEDEERRKALETIEVNIVQVTQMAESLGTFSDVMARAVERNPEIRRMRAAVEMAQADFDGTLAEVTSQLRGLHLLWEVQVGIFEREVEALEDSRVTADHASASSSLRRTNHTLEAITKTYSEIMELSGGGRGGRPNRIAGPAPMGGFAAFAQMRIPQPRPDFSEGTPENLTRILANPVSFIFTEISVMDIFGFISDTYDLYITVDLAFTPPVIRHIELRNVPLRNALLALTDQMGDACFVIRDYGLFLTTRERAGTLAGVTIPEDVPYFAPIAPGQFQGGFGGGGGGFGGGGGGFGFGGGFGGGGGGFGGFGARGPGAPNGGAAAGDPSEAVPPPGKPDE